MTDHLVNASPESAGRAHVCDMISGAHGAPTDLEFRRGDGSTIWLAVTCRPLHDDAQRRTGTVCVAADVTERRRREIEEEAARAGPKIQLVVALLLVPSVLLLVAAALAAALLDGGGVGL